jgi:hypothetical protein
VNSDDRLIRAFVGDADQVPLDAITTYIKQTIGATTEEQKIVSANERKYQRTQTLDTLLWVAGFDSDRKSTQVLAQAVATAKLTLKEPLRREKKQGTPVRGPPVCTRSKLSCTIIHTVYIPTHPTPPPTRREINLFNY